MIITGNIFDLNHRRFCGGKITISNNLILSIEWLDTIFSNFILPGFVDSHVHIESSMLTPTRFSELIVPRGTIGVVADPHEIVNVCGVAGVEFMLDDAKRALNKIFFGVPSCVPATPFETSGFALGIEDTAILLKNEAVVSLAEMMNFPGVLNDDPFVLLKLDAAKSIGKPIDGHAPGLRGEALSKYIGMGVCTDHECFTLEEALEKIEKGMMVQIREGSAAKNFNDLAPLISLHPDKIMFCSDDCHPDEIVRDGHIDKVVRRALALGYDVFDVIKAASLNAINFYKLPVGQLRVGDKADFIVVDNLNDFTVLETYVDGEKVFGTSSEPTRNITTHHINNFTASKITASDLVVPAISLNNIRVIEARDGDLLTDELHLKPLVINGCVESDIENDVLKLVVINRYIQAKPQIGFIKGFNLKTGALGGSVAHDSHNLILIGTNDDDILALANAIIDLKGGIGSCVDGKIDLLELPIAGLMSARDGVTVAHDYERLNENAKLQGSSLFAPFMTLAFMSLLVIPSLKLGDKGLFDSKNFKFVDLFVE